VQRRRRLGTFVALFETNSRDIQCERGEKHSEKLIAATTSTKGHPQSTDRLKLSQVQIEREGGKGVSREKEEETF